MDNVLAETNHFIVLDKYTKKEQMETGYQTEAELEQEFVTDLQNQGYERIKLTSTAEMLSNIKTQLEALNQVQFNHEEWARFVSLYLDSPSDNLINKSEKVHEDYIYAFKFDDETIKNIYLFDKNCIARNKVQVMTQFEQTGKFKNRYDVTILVNGLPLVQIELKKRGIPMIEAFHQIHRYRNETFNLDDSLYKYLQIFVISNGTNTRYFANTTKRDKSSFDFTMNWARSDNEVITDLKDFTATFFQKNTLLNILLHYCVFDASKTLLIMRPYQIAATERILWKIKSSYENQTYGVKGHKKGIKSGGFIWHTTGSGKTLTSFKAARLATELDFIDKVFFVVDRKDLDYQTMKEYQKFSPDSVNGSNNTKALKANLEKQDNKIIVTTIQKLNHLIKSEPNLPIYDKQVVFIFDECHRSQFGEAQKNIKQNFKKFYQFGFTGTPIFPENALGSETTANVFGNELHHYVVTDAIRDEKVLKFKVDYNDVRPEFKQLEQEQDEQKLSAAETKNAFLHPNRIQAITDYILKNFNHKTHRTNGSNGFNAMFAVSSIEAAKAYYEAFKAQNAPLKIAMIFSFSANETQAQNAMGEILEEEFEPTHLNQTSKVFLNQAIADYNALFHQSFSVEGEGFQNYYRDVAKRVKDKQVDLLIVVGMFLTGFDAPTLNTLFVDKNLRYHGLMQAFSRTNRIYNATKTFGNIVCFRDLEQNTIDAIRLFGKKNTKAAILEKSFKEYLQGTESQRGFIDIVNELKSKFESSRVLSFEADKKEFVQLFGEYLKVENKLQNFDEYQSLKAFQNVDLDDPKALATFQETHFLDDKQMASLVKIELPSAREIQDYRSTYNDIREAVRERSVMNQLKETAEADRDKVVFEVDLLKSQEINLDFIIALIHDQHQKQNNKAALIEEARRLIRGSIENRAKENLVVNFIEKTDLNDIEDKSAMLAAFFAFARKAQQTELAALIAEEQLEETATKRYLALSLKRGYASEEGTALTDCLPKMNRFNPAYAAKKQTVFAKISDFVRQFKGVNG